LLIEGLVLLICYRPRATKIRHCSWRYSKQYERQLSFDCKQY